MRQFVEANKHSQMLKEQLGLGAGSGRIKVLFLLREQPMTLAQLADAHGVDRPYATIIGEPPAELRALDDGQLSELIGLLSLLR